MRISVVKIWQFRRNCLSLQPIVLLYGWEEFKTQVLDVADAAFHPSMEDALKRVPKEYPADAPYADFMRMKSYGLMMPIDDKFITAPRLAQRVAALFKTTKPMIDYINRAVDYAKEEM